MKAENYLLCATEAEVYQSMGLSSKGQGEGKLEAVADDKQSGKRVDIKAGKGGVDGARVLARQCLRPARYL
jgi:hypothetical protein